VDPLLAAYWVTGAPLTGPAGLCPSALMLGGCTSLALGRRENPAFAQRLTSRQKASVATGLGFEASLCVHHGRLG